jgi:hypothetical protein
MESKLTAKLYHGATGALQAMQDLPGLDEHDLDRWSAQGFKWLTEIATGERVRALRWAEKAWTCIKLCSRMRCRRE